MSKQMVETEYSYPLVKVFLNRPGVLNAYNEQVLDSLTETFEELFDDDRVEAIVFTGRGQKAFTVGADLDWLEELDSSSARDISRKGQTLCDLIENSSKVVVAAINGYALGGGMEFCLACDLRIASTRARFGQPEVSLGIVPGFGGTRRLPRLIGLGQAKELLFTGSIIDAEEAYEIGLVNKLVTPRDLLQKSEELAREITEQSARAVSLIKEIINRRGDSDISGHFETKAFGLCFENQEHLERIKKLKEIIENN